MCGIIGANSNRNIVDILINGLKKLEYRGYDSAGIGIIDNKNNIYLYKKVGKVSNLEKSIYYLDNFQGSIGIAHTRWATHGRPTEKNSHPHMSKNFCIVHNGIIDNFYELKKMLINNNYKFKSDTDSEVIVHLLEKEWNDNFSIIKNVKNIIAILKGIYAFAIISTKFPDKIVAICSGSPLVVGFGINENFISSDILSMSSITDKFCYLDNGNIAIISKNNIDIFDKDGILKNLIIKEYKNILLNINKNGYKHYMIKEIYEQPDAIENTILSILKNNKLNLDIFNKNIKSLLKKIKNIYIVACGSSYNASMIGQHWIEKYARISCNTEIASEARYRDRIIIDNSLFLSISQSGETADTLESLRKSFKQDYIGSISICNIINSSIARESDFTFITKAGIEISVASTKTFTTQLIILALFSLIIAKYHNTLSNYKILKYIEELKNIKYLVIKILNINSKICKISKYFFNKKYSIFLGRGIYYPVALEGALKLKEISYMYAEAYPFGELKHGPLSLVDKNTLIVAIVSNDSLLNKTLSNLEEINARGGKLIIFIDKNIKKIINFDNSIVLKLDTGYNFSAPIIFTVALQLLAYYIALAKGANIDQPRNLAKSVTVE